MRKFRAASTRAQANAVREGRETEFDQALDRFCDEWNRGTRDSARFELEYLLAVGTRRLNQ